MPLNSVLLDNDNVYPSKVICIGRNYVEHIKELNNDTPTEPVIFLKPNSAVSNTIQSLINEPIHYEAEICFLIKSGQIFAVGFGLDLTKRELQTQLKTKGLPWERAKAFDGSAVFSDFIAYSGKLSDLRLELWINNSLIQHADYDLMIHKPDALLNDIKTFMTCEDNDILMTGTPKGVGVIHTGDVFTGKIFSSDILLCQLIKAVE